MLSTLVSTRFCAVPTLSMMADLMSPAAYFTSAIAKLPSLKALPIASFALRIVVSSARSRIVSASACAREVDGWAGGAAAGGGPARRGGGTRRRTFFLSSECPFLAPTNLSFMICGRGEAADAQPRRRGGGQQKGYGRRPRLQVLARREGPRRRHVGGGGREWCTATGEGGILFSALPVRASPVPRVVRGSLLRKSFQCLC